MARSIEIVSFQNLGNKDSEKSPEMVIGPPKPARLQPDPQQTFRCSGFGAKVSTKPGAIQTPLRDEGLSSLLRASHLRSSSKINMPAAKGMMKSHTSFPMGAVPRMEFPQGL